MNAVKNCFDRETGSPVPASQLKTYQQALAQYHLSPETKFLNGNYLEYGRTSRRHVRSVATKHIGKEANHWEEQFFLGLDSAEQIEYGISSDGVSRLRETLSTLAAQIGQRELVRQIGISRTTLAKFLQGMGMSPITKNKIMAAFSTLTWHRKGASGQPSN